MVWYLPSGYYLTTYPITDGNGMSRLSRERTELAAFLTGCRERLQPSDVGLPGGSRRRTKGLRREEVAALAGVGVTWYTWLEQGRTIGVSGEFLDRLSSVLKLDVGERRHLYALALDRLPNDRPATWRSVPPLMARIAAELDHHPVVVMNGRWDVLYFSEAADRLFGYGAHAEDYRNLLWLMFTDPHFLSLYDPWSAQAQDMVARFRRDYVAVKDDARARQLVDDLNASSPEFRVWWQAHGVRSATSGPTTVRVDGKSRRLDHATLSLDEERLLRLVIYLNPEDPEKDADEANYPQREHVGDHDQDH
jgi:transcriptional regulator with XRE-family HTH domain